jgi:hypothetical protein
MAGVQPARPGRAGWTRGGLLAPIDPAGLGVNASSLAGLPVIVTPHGPEPIDAKVILTLNQPCRLQEVGVHDHGPRQERPLLQCGMDVGSRGTIGRGADGGVDIRDQVWRSIRTRFGKRDVIADPRRCVLAGIVGGGAVGGTDARRHGRDVVYLAPLELGAILPIRLDPDLTQAGDGRRLAPPGRRMHVIDNREPPPPLGPNGQRERGTGGLCRREPVVFGPPYTPAADNGKAELASTHLVVAFPWTRPLRPFAPAEGLWEVRTYPGCGKRQIVNVLCMHTGAFRLTRLSVFYP